MDWLPINSTAVSSVAYDPSKRAFYVEFQSGEQYRYFEFPPELFEEFLAAESKGKFFGRWIRDRFPYEHLPRTRRAGGR